MAEARDDRGPATTGAAARAVPGVFAPWLDRRDAARTDREGRPDLLVSASVVEIVDRLADRSAVDWAATNVFVPDASTRAGLTELDLAIIDTIDVLADVCARPHDRLDHETELVRAGLARRVPPRGLIRLAAHTEDWAGIEHGSILPRRLLTTRYTTDIDFYENRVAAQLVDRLSGYLRRRITELRLLADGLADLDEYNRALGRRQSWRAQHRIARLVSEVTADHRSSAAVLTRSIEALARLVNRLNVMRATPVMRRADRKVRLPMRLLRTNLFVEERRYRKVGQLWEIWAGHETTAIEWQKQIDARFSEAYVSYVMILIVRSLMVLGYMPDGPVTRSVHLRRNRESLTVAPDDEAGITIRSGGRIVARLIPLGLDLSGPVSETVRTQWISAIARDRRDIVVYPGLRSDRAALAESDRALLHSSSRGVVPLTPLEIEGEERLARALRWPLQGRRYLDDYPSAIRTKLVIRPADWFRPGTTGPLHISRRPNADEVVIEAGQNSGRRRDDIRRQEAGIEALLADIDTNMSIIDTCPLCSKAGARLIPRDFDTFRCECSCLASWGTNRCGSCRHRSPFLLARNAVVDSSNGDRLDMTVGADLLTATCASSEPGREPRFRCAWCGICPGMPACDCGPP